MTPPVRLHVNIDHVATVRNARGTAYPDPVEAALQCLEAGAHGITAHLREDRRHIVDADVERLRQAVTTTFNLEMAATDEMVAIACRVRPDVVTLVPERRAERTTEGGSMSWALAEELGECIRRLQQAGIRVSLFIAPDRAQLEASAALRVEQVELHTGEYAHAFPQGTQELARLHRAAKEGHSLGLEVAAGHGLTRANVEEVVATPDIVELNIGHALVADALFLSLAGATKAMNEAIARGVGRRP